MAWTSMKEKLVVVIQDGDGILQVLDREKAITEAVEIYSKYRPWTRVDDIPGDGTYDYTLPTHYDHDKSNIQHIEFPAGNRDPEFLDDTAWLIYRSATTTYKLRLTTATPQVSEIIRMTYSTTHIVDAGSSSLPGADEDAVVNKAAAICCGWLAAHYSQQGESTLNAQVANHQSKADHYRRQIKIFDQMFDAYMGLGDKVPVAAAGVIIAMGPTDYPWGEARLTHRRHVHGA